MPVVFRARPLFRRLRRALPFGIGADRAVAVDKADLTLTGRTITATTSQAIAPASLALTGQEIVLNRALPVGDIDISLTGRNIGQTVTHSILPAALALDGKSIVIDRGAPFDAGVLTLTGNDIEPTTDRIISFDAGVLTLTGHAISLLSLAPPGRRPPLHLRRTSSRPASIWRGTVNNA